MAPDTITAAHLNKLTENGIDDDEVQGFDCDFGFDAPDQTDGNLTNEELTEIARDAGMLTKRGL